jgi:hypothetical protein
MPSSVNWTPAMGTAPEAVAATATDAPETVAPFAGAVRETAGGATGTPEVGSSARKTSLRAEPFISEVNKT